MTSLTVLLAACANGPSTTFSSTWQPSGAQPVSAAGMHIATVYINENDGNRRVGEDVLADEVTRYGGVGIPSYTILSDNPQDRERAKRALQQAGVQAVLLMRVVSREQDISYKSSYWNSSPMHSSLWSYWDYGWGAVRQPGYLNPETHAGVETLLYSLVEERLLWAGMSHTIDPTTVNSVVTEVARQVVKQMNEENVLVR
jgi:hypothetical protein